MALSSPNILNYKIGKGAAFIRRSGETNFRHLGNCPEFEFTPELEKLEHFSSLEGIKSRDRSIVISKKATLRIVMEELTAENWALFMLSDIALDSGGDQEGNIFPNNSIDCEIKFVDSNEIGPKFENYFPNCQIIPSGAVQFISEEWMGLEISADVNLSGTSFGTWRKVADGA